MQNNIIYQKSKA